MRVWLLRVYRAGMAKPNTLLIMTNEERYPPPYQNETVKTFHKDLLTARESIGNGSLEFHRECSRPTACLPSRAATPGERSGWRHEKGAHPAA
jgi:arylsulfatase A-like enzyme